MVQQTQAGNDRRERVLVVVDGVEATSAIAGALANAGFAPETARTGGDALAAAARLQPEVLVLDLRLPDVSGIQVCRRVRESASLAHTPILMIGRDDYDRVLALEAGADDYVSRPCIETALEARVRLLVERGASSGAPPESSRVPIRAGRLELDVDSHRAFVDGVEVDLTLMEFKLAQTFVGRPNHAFTRAELLEAVWGIHGNTQTRTIDTHIRRLRLRLGTGGRSIETIRGVGYRYNAPGGGGAAIA